MKKIIQCVIFFLIMFLSLPVHAANYEFEELIPEGVTTTIRGDTLLYQNISYQDGIVSIKKIKNNSKESAKVTISIGLFDEDKKNVGTINYCTSDETLASKEEKENFTIEVTSYLGDGKHAKDISYFAVLSENTSCRKSGSKDFIGQTISQMKQGKNNQLTDSTKMLIDIIIVVVVILVGLFLYRFLFTTAYRNMDGEDVRQEYAYINKELRKEREYNERVNPPPPKEIKKIKTDEVLQQEKEQNEKQDSDLSNLYK